MFDRILIPVDGSEPATRAAKIGLTLAAKYDAHVDVLHVLEGRSRSSERYEAARTERGREILQSVTDLDAAGDRPVETHLVRGQPAKAIRAHVREHDVDLLAMGRRGRTRFTERLLGSVTERVLRKTRVPVLAVPAVESTPDIEWSCGDILLTTDGSDVAELAAPYAADLARTWGATLHLLNVVDVQGNAGLFDAGGVDRAFVERLEAQGRDALDRLADAMDVDASEIDLQSSLRKGTPHAEIGAYAGEKTVDLIVIASEGQTNLVGQHLGSVTRRVLQTANRPVLVVPTPN
jgi:nucleotide-binding universal stress UspA family protein